MQIASIKEQNSKETRVAITPSVAKRLKSLGHHIIIEKGIGSHAGYSDKEYIDAGAEISSTAANIYQTADILLQIAPPPAEIIKKLSKKQLLVADFSLTKNIDIPKNTQIIRLELVPRTSVAQSIDILSSQSTIRGYVGALYALYHSPIIAPQMMTAAASIKAASALVIGASITGLQAASVFKRIGCRVTILDINEQNKDLAASVGADFAQAENQQQLNSLLKDKDFIFAAVSSATNKTPTIIKQSQLKFISPHSVVVDTTINNITIDSSVSPYFHFHRNLYFERLTPISASELWANNMYNLLNLIITAKNTFDLSLNYIAPMLNGEIS